MKTIRRISSASLLSLILAMPMGMANSVPSTVDAAPGSEAASASTTATDYIWKNRNSLKYLYGQTNDDVVTLGKSSESQVTAYGRWNAIFNGSYRLYKNKATGGCLDSNSSGHVYLNPCSTGNSFQNWLLVSEGDGFYRMKNRATGLCLDSNYSGSVYTNPCSSSNAYQHWS